MNNLGNKTTMAKNIQRQLDKYGKTRTDICKDLNIAYTTFTDWVNAKKYPRIDKIETMANYFGVSKADLVEEQSNTKNDDRLNVLLQEPYMKEIYETLLQIKPESRKMILAQIEAVKHHEVTKEK